MIYGTDLQTLDYAYLGEVFCDTPGKSAIDTWTIDYAYLGEAFVTNQHSVTITFIPKIMIIF